MANSMAIERCADCNAVIALVGLRHNCISRGSPLVDRQHLGAPAVKSALAHSAPPVEETESGLVDAPSTPRESTTYKYRNPEKRRADQRELMRRRRAKDKTND